MWQPPFAAVTKALEVHRQCCYLNWTLKDTGPWSKAMWWLTKRPGIFIKKTEKHKTYFRHKEEAHLAGLKDMEGKRRWPSKAGNSKHEGCEWWAMRQLLRSRVGYDVKIRKNRCTKEAKRSKSQRCFAFTILKMPLPLSRARVPRCLWWRLVASP